MILEKIVIQKKEVLKKEFGDASSDEIKRRLLGSKVSPALDAASILKKGKNISIIAEIKPASPSKGIFNEEVNPDEIAMKYFRGGADMISVLTEEDFFKGSKDNLVKVRQKIPLPVLRKDFIIDSRQIYQSRMLGADALLLITSILNDEQLRRFQVISKILGMSNIVEVHNERELQRALESGAEIIGINNRNLGTFEVDLKTTEELIKMIPKNIIVVSESGISSRKDIEYLESLGVNSVLIGETLMRAENPEEKLKELRGVI